MGSSCGAGWQPAADCQSAAPPGYTGCVLGQARCFHHCQCRRQYRFTLESRPGSIRTPNVGQTMAFCGLSHVAQLCDFSSTPCASGAHHQPVHLPDVLSGQNSFSPATAKRAAWPSLTTSGSASFKCTIVDPPTPHAPWAGTRTLRMGDLNVDPLLLRRELYHPSLRLSGWARVAKILPRTRKSGCPMWERSSTSGRLSAIRRNWLAVITPQPPESRQCLRDGVNPVSILLTVSYSNNAVKCAWRARRFQAPNSLFERLAKRPTSL